MNKEITDKTIYYDKKFGSETIRVLFIAKGKIAATSRPLEGVFGKVVKGAKPFGVDISAKLKTSKAKIKEYVAECIEELMKTSDFEVTMTYRDDTDKRARVKAEYINNGIRNKVKNISIPKMSLEKHKYQIMRHG
jgi:hypothetical protein